MVRLLNDALPQAFAVPCLNQDQGGSSNIYAVVTPRMDLGLAHDPDPSPGLRGRPPLA